MYGFQVLPWWARLRLVWVCFGVCGPLGLWGLFFDVLGVSCAVLRCWF